MQYVIVGAEMIVIAVIGVAIYLATRKK